MDPAYSALLALLEAGIWERPVASLEPFRLTPAQWQQVYQLAVRQTVTGIAYRGIHHIPDQLLPPDAIMIRWAATADQIERRNRRMDAALASLTQRMRLAGITPVVLKGQAIAALYPHPLFRECGDIDLYFRTADEASAAAQLMQQAGCQLQSHADGSVSYAWQGFEVEHHTRLFDIYSPFQQRRLASIVERYGFVEQTISAPGVEPFKVTVPAPVPTLLMLSVHLLKHMMGHGVGLRQFCDIAVAYSALAGQYSRDELRAIYRSLRLTRWGKKLNTFLIHTLSAPISSLPYRDCAPSPSPAMLRIVLSGGNFGQYGSTRGNAQQGALARKWRTFRSYLSHVPFSISAAPGEAFWNLATLITGNIR